MTTNLQNQCVCQDGKISSQYNDPLNYLLIGAAIVALLIHPDEPGDVIFIFMVLTANATSAIGKKGKNKQWNRSKNVFRSVLLSETILMSKLRKNWSGDIVNLYEGLNVPADINFGIIPM